MKIMYLVLFLGLTLFASQRDVFVKHYQNKEYKDACFFGKEILKNYRRDEDFVSAYGFACLYSDNIDLIAPSVMYLKSTPEARKNASFLSAIVSIKKILYMSVVDGIDITDLHFPKLDHILSTVFTKYTKNDFVKEGEQFIFNLDNNERIVMESKFHRGKDKLYIYLFRNGEKVKTHIYW